jgi:hypothetical protein
MKNLSSVTIVTIPLVYYHENLYWGLYTEYRGKIRKEILSRQAAGKQIPFAFDRAILGTDDILIITDDKFNFEVSLDKDNIPSNNELVNFLIENPLPESWTAELKNKNLLSRIVKPPIDFECSKYTFSEKKLYLKSRHKYSMPGECANEWTGLMKYLDNLGYSEINAYVPKVCADGICYSTPFIKENEIFKNPINIKFTDKFGISSEYNS